MFADELRECCLAQPGAAEDEPFGPGVLVYKVAGKMFGLLAENGETGHMRANLKCDPERAVELRAQFAAITPGYHMNKKHWNSLELDGSLDPSR